MNILSNDNSNNHAPAARLSAPPAPLPLPLFYSSSPSMVTYRKTSAGTSTTSVISSEAAVAAGRKNQIGSGGGISSTAASTAALMAAAASDAYWHAELLDTLFSYCILAASSTFAAGDAFLILNDLYGGEGLNLCPFNNDIVNNSSKSNSKLNAAGSSSSLATTLATANTTIAITASGVKVTLKDHYNLFVAAEMNACSNIAQLKPLMRFECNTTTLIILNQQSSAAAATATSANTKQTDKHKACGALFQTLISNPEKICHRAITIRPYL